MIQLLNISGVQKKLIFIQARSQGGARGATHPPNLAKGPLLATKWAKNGVTAIF